MNVCLPSELANTEAIHVLSSGISLHPVLRYRGVALGYYGSPLWLWVPGIIGVTLVQSAFTGFCPVYYTLDKIRIGDSRQ